MMEDHTTSRGGEKTTGNQVTYPKKRAAIAVSNYPSLDGQKSETV